MYKVLEYCIEIKEKNKMSKRELTPLGKLLREFRKSNQVSATQMAAELSMSESRLFKVETGELAVPRNFYFAFLQTFENYQCDWVAFRNAYLATAKELACDLTLVDENFNKQFLLFVINNLNSFSNEQLKNAMACLGATTPQTPSEPF